MLEHCEEAQIRPVLTEIFERILDLTRDIYGNYVISHVLEHGQASDKLFIINKIRKKVLMLSCHKFGSNVIEKCLVHGEKKQKEDIISEILLAKLSSPDGCDSESAARVSSNAITFKDLMRDKYGNYVIQRVIDISSEPVRRQLIDKVLKAAASMKKHKSHARHVFNFLEKSYGITVVFNDDDASSAKGSERKSSTTVTGAGKNSSISKNSTLVDSASKQRATNSCVNDKQAQLNP